MHVVEETGRVSNIQQAFWHANSSQANEQARQVSGFEADLW
jgi:hypothetical protein